MEQKKNSQVGNSFVIGVVVGVVITLLFTTKKGRKILRSLTDEGYGRFSELEGLLSGGEEKVGDETIDMESEEMAGDDYIKPLHKANNNQNQQNRNISHSRRRFFRGAPKR